MLENDPNKFCNEIILASRRKKVDKLTQMVAYPQVFHSLVQRNAMKLLREFSTHLWPLVKFFEKTKFSIDDQVESFWPTQLNLPII